MKAEAKRKEWTRLHSICLFVCCFFTTHLVAGEIHDVKQIDVPVGESFNGTGFTYTLRHLRDDEHHSVYALTYPSPVETDVPENNVIPAEYYLPANIDKSDEPRPGVICLHILNGNFELVRLLCSVMADNGVPAMFFKLPYYGERGGREGTARLLKDVQLFSEALEQSLQDVRRTADILASRPEIDKDHIGISGISLGAILAASACGVEPRLSRAQLILGGGSLEAILNHADETHEFQKSLAVLSEENKNRVLEAIRGVDPLNHAKALRSLARRGRLGMVNAENDEVIPEKCTIQLAEAAGMTNDVVWLKDMGHYTAMAALPQIASDTASFFAEDLPPGIKPPSSSDKDLPPLQALASFIRQVAIMMGPPEMDHCHYIKLNIEVTPADSKPTDYRVLFISGGHNRFRLEAGPVPKIGTMQIGWGRYPWMCSADGKVFVGTADSPAEVTPPAILRHEHQEKINVLRGALFGIAMAPHAFKQYIEVAETETGTGERCLAFKIDQKKLQADGRLRLNRPEMKPLELSLEVDDIACVIEFEQWEINGPAHPELFAEPSTVERKSIPANDLARMLSALLNFAMEKIQ